MTPLNTRGRERAKIARQYGGVYPDVIYSLRKSGKKASEIADIFNISEGTVNYHLTKHGFNKRPRAGNFKLTDETIKGVFLHPGSGIEAGKKYKVSASTAHKIKNTDKRYRAKLESMGLVKKTKIPKTKAKTQKRPCLKCGKLFTRTDKNWAVCPVCDRLNKKKQWDMTTYYQNQA